MAFQFDTLAVLQQDELIQGLTEFELDRWQRFVLRGILAQSYQVGAKVRYMSDNDSPASAQMYRRICEADITKVLDDRKIDGSVRSFILDASNTAYKEGFYCQDKSPEYLYKLIMEDLT